MEFVLGFRCGVSASRSEEASAFRPGRLHNQTMTGAQIKGRFFEKISFFTK